MRRAPAAVPHVDGCAHRTSDKSIFLSRRLSLAQHRCQGEKQGEKNNVVDKELQQVSARLRIAGARVDAQGDEARE